MDFYEEFVNSYDRLVSLENRIERESNFFKRIFSENNVKTILDCACGTGHHVIMLKQMGYTVIGSDQSPSMIKQAKINSEKYGIRTSFQIADFRNLTNVFHENFDAIVCVGNSLPHLFSDEDLTKAICEMYYVLNKNGILIIDQRNYDKLVKKRQRFFPISFRDDEIFLYVLDYFPNKIVFNIIVIEIEKRKIKTYSTEYNPLKKRKLISMLQMTGFKDMKLYQDHEFNDFDLENSDNLIIVCKKIK
ncbi:MAG: class I SAM-dependent methyltransferase [Promethearchaeota archaeon]